MQAHYWRNETGITAKTAMDIVLAAKWGKVSGLASQFMEPCRRWFRGCVASGLTGVIGRVYLLAPPQRAFDRLWRARMG
jgi:hypothetical protein